MKTRRIGQSKFQTANVQMDIEERALEDHNFIFKDGYLQELEKSPIKSQDSGIFTVARFY